MTDRLESAETSLTDMMNCNRLEIAQQIGKAHFAKYTPSPDKELRKRWKEFWGGQSENGYFDKAIELDLLATEARLNQAKVEALDEARAKIDKLLNVKYFQKNIPANIIAIDEFIRELQSKYSETE